MRGLVVPRNWVALFFTVDLGFALGMAGDWSNA